MCLKAKKDAPHTSLLGVGGSIYTFNTCCNILKSSALTHKRSTRLPLNCMLTPCIMLTNWLQQDLHLKKQDAPKALVWSRGVPATLQIPTCYPFHRWRRLTALRANVSPFPELMQELSCCLRRKGRKPMFAVKHLLPA